MDNFDITGCIYMFFITVITVTVIICTCKNDKK